MSNELNQRIGARIRAAREGRFSQSDLARALGYSQAAISKFELGQRNIALPDLLKVGELLGKPLDYFVSASPPAESDAILSSVLERLDVSVLPVYYHASESDSAVREEPPEYLTFPRMFLKGADFAVRVRGVAFEPDIQNDDIVLVRRQAQAENGHYIVIRVDDYRYAVRRYRSADEGSDNHPSRIVGRVVRLVRDM